MRPVRAVTRGMRRVGSLFGGGGRWVRPGRRSVVALVVVVGLTAAGAGWLWHRTTRSASPARTLALAGSVHRGPFSLDAALDVTWAWAVRGSAALEERWLALVAPTLPPGLCLAGEEAGRGALDGALRRLAGGVARGADRAELERRLSEVRAEADVARGSRASFLVRYGLARGYAAAGDWAAAAEVLEPVFDDHLSVTRVPQTRAGDAGARVRSGAVDRELAVDAFHGRYLAGTVAYHRGEPERAVAYFRRAINAVHYLLALDGAGTLSAEGHWQRVTVDTGPAACGAGGPDSEPLTSLDAYAGLVAAYMADADFRDPGGLPREVARTRLEMDPDDPFRPVLEHARRTRGDPERTPIPENLLWAASNLQRVYHHNRLRPDPRLEVTRAVLLLHLTRDTNRAEALARTGGGDVCAMLGALGRDLHRDAAAGELGRRGVPGAADSARAAVAVQAFARLDRGCPGAAGPVLDRDVRSAWVRLGGGYLNWGLAGRYEETRRAVASLLSGEARPLPVLEEELEARLVPVQGHLAALRRGRVPPELPAELPVDEARAYTDGWWEALFGDVARTLARRARGSTGAGPAGGRGGADAPIRAGEVPDLLTALESATAHAGLRPSDVYGGDETASLLAASEGGMAAATWRLRTLVRDHPRASAVLLAGLVLALAVAALLVHVSWWRYHLLVRQRLWVEESLARTGRSPDGTRSGGGEAAA